MAEDDVIIKSAEYFFKKRYVGVENRENKKITLKKK